MTTFGPQPWRMSLLERLAGAQIVVLGRVLGVADRIPDPETDAQAFALLDVERLQTLRGDIPGHIQVRIAETQGAEKHGWTIPVEKGAELLLVLSRDEYGDPPRYALQHSSGFRVRDDVIELPEQVDAGPLRPKDGEPITVSHVAKLLARIDDNRAHREAQLRETEGDAHKKAQTPEMLERPSEEEMRRGQDAFTPGPREGGPGTRWYLDE